VPRRKETRPRKAQRIARLLAARYGRQRPLRRPLARRETKPRRHELIAYDLETTPIPTWERYRATVGKRASLEGFAAWVAQHQPEPLYLTGYGADFYLAAKVTGYEQLAELIVTRMLLPELRGARFVAWNGNHFDAYFIAKALLARPEYDLRPYFAKGNKLRGLRVELRGSAKPKLAWEFLDGIAMTGVPMRLARFLELFAPDYGKLAGPDFEAGESFDADKPEHRRYAIRDSEGLYHALMRAEAILCDTFGVPFSPTIGATGIRIFQRQMPEGVLAWQPPHEALEIIRRVVYRGGYCLMMRRYRGPVWKYDVNQAYAAAMREERLPCGSCVWTTRRPQYAPAWIARVVTARHAANRVPFYYRDLEGNAQLGLREIGETWLTSVEIEQLEREGWRLDLAEFWAWDASFAMSDFVNGLEQLRSSCEGGPAGAIGTMVKAVGNNSYGKMAEQLDAIEVQLAREQPEGFSPYDDIEGELNGVWFRFVRPQLREYHQPQIAAWITASVRMKLRRAALLAPLHFIYADTDAVMYSRAVELPISKTVYGLWKVEAEAVPYIVCTKKVYAAEDGSAKHAKGLHVERLELADFIRWHEGEPPVQIQAQRKNWLRFVTGEAMFAPLSKVGQIKAA